MYFNILKRDLKRKKTMNTILLVFVILASMFMASSMSNISSVMNALDSYFDEANVPDYLVITRYEEEAERLESMLDENGYENKRNHLINIPNDNFLINGKSCSYHDAKVVRKAEGAMNLFTENDEIIKTISDDEIYVSNSLSSKADIAPGDIISIKLNDETLELKVNGPMKDAVFGTTLIGMGSMAVSDSNYEKISECDFINYCVENIYTDDSGFTEKFNEIEMNMEFQIDRETIKTTYILDIITVFLLIGVSLCLIIISILMLKFTINFTISEEFREIGVMKAIGLTNTKIRGLYLVKYLAISIVGTVIGFALSIPFANVMLSGFTGNVVITQSGNLLLSFAASLTVCLVVLLCCWLCTKGIKKLTPIAAIRSGESGERFRRKSIITLEKSRLRPALFMAFNDILSNFRRYASLFVIFTLGCLILTVPINALKTLSSDEMCFAFGMAPSDLVIGIEDKLPSSYKEEGEKIADELKAEGWDCYSFCDFIYKSNISCGDRKAASLSMINTGGAKTDEFPYLEGVAPVNADEVALTHVTAEAIGAKIGDKVTVKTGSVTNEYIVTALFQSMNNLGEGIRFNENAELNSEEASGSFGIQIRFNDKPSKAQIDERRDFLKKLYPDYLVLDINEQVLETSGSGDMLEAAKIAVLSIVIIINILATILMAKNFIAKDRKEIALLKAIGFGNGTIILWQNLRIGIILILSAFVAAAFSTPLCSVFCGYVFHMLGLKEGNVSLDIVSCFVTYPSIILGFTITAGLIASLSIRKIKSSETSGNE